MQIAKRSINQSAMASSRWVAVAVTFMAILGNTDLLAQRRVGERTPSSWQNYAELTSVQFSDSENGWAVGEHGTILRSSDGGKTWKNAHASTSLSPQQGAMSSQMQQLVDNVRASSGSTTDLPAQTIRQRLDIRLMSRSFVDSQHGVITGGYFSPGTPVSRGITYATRDGGETWSQMTNAISTKLNFVQMDNRQTGWAAGFHSHQLESGLFNTFDGGRTWQVDAAMVPGNWRQAARAGANWVLLSTEGELFLYNEGRLEHSVLTGVPGAVIHGLVMLDDQQGWAVGERGAFWKTTNGGLSWQAALSPLDQAFIRHFDLRAITYRSGKLWLAGNPGTFIFSLNVDEGKLDRTKTPAANRFNDLAFADDWHGLAVGSCGAILRTDDGGRTWGRVHGVDETVSLLAIGLDSDDLGFEAIAKATATEPLKTAGLRLELNRRGVTIDRVEQAATRLGVDEVRSIRVESTASHLSASDRGELVYQLVRIIRELQPRVVVLGPESHDQSKGIDAYQLIDEVIKNAALAEYFPDQLSATGLVPWQVSRLALPTELDGGDWQIDRTAILGVTGLILEDEVALSRALVDAPLQSPLQLRYKFVDYRRLLRSGKQTGLTNGIAESGFPLPQKDKLFLRTSNLHQLSRLAQKSTIVNHMLTLPLKTTRDLFQWELSLGNWLQSVDRETAGIWLGQLAETYLTNGDFNAAARTLDFLVGSYPEHALTTAAYAALARHVSSEEIMLTTVPIESDSPAKTVELPLADKADERFQFRPLSDAPHGDDLLADSIPNEISRVWKANDRGRAAVESDEPGDDQVVPSGFMEDGIEENPDNMNELVADSGELPARAWYGNAVEFFKKLRQRDPELASLPIIKALEAHIQQQSSGWEESQNLFRSLIRKNDVDWQIKDWALSEISVHDAASSIDALICSQAPQRPYLDGILDDPMWTEIQTRGLDRSIKNLGGQTDWMGWAYDQEYLYLGARCQKAPGVIYRPINRQRARNADLTSFDHLEFSLDLDRDTRFPLRFSVDSRGAACDGCGSSSSWDPDWHIASSQTDVDWTLEVAIPWKSIGCQVPQPDDFWRIGVARVLPRKTVTYWDLPAPDLAARTLLEFPRYATEKFSWLRFE